MLATKLSSRILFLLLCSFSAFAVDIQFPPEELPSESVTPILDSRQAVRSRLVSFEKRFEFQGGTGYYLDEPFYQNQFFGLTGLYHFNETWGVGFSYYSWVLGLSDYSKQFESDLPSLKLNFGRGRQFENALVFSLHQRLMYGKISWSKGYVTPMSLNMLYETGMAKYGKRSLPFISAGFGHRVFFNLKMGFVLNLKMVYRQIFDPVSIADGLSATYNPIAPSEDSFKTKFKLGSGLDVNFFYLF